MQPWAGDIKHLFSSFRAVKWFAAALPRLCRGYQDLAPSELTQVMF